MALLDHDGQDQAALLTGAHGPARARLSPATLEHALRGEPVQHLVVE